ncbi:MAG: hypothetical protein E3J35_09605 [Methanomassiliicoccales archaeon]|nr:MAG: hypothetical protein E3J35_09605 [Methanomassiliicoccales archaeon]
MSRGVHRSLLCVVLSIWLLTSMLVVLPEYATAGLATVSSEPEIYVPSGSGAELLLDDLDNLYWLHIISGDVYFRRYNASHTLEVPDKSLYTSGSNLNVDAVWDDFGNIHFTWATDFFGAQSIMYAKIDKNGDLLVSPVKLSGDNNAQDFCSAIDVNSLGQAYVAWDYWWNPPDWATQDVLYAKIDSDGSTIFTQQYVAPVGWDSDFRWKKDILVDNDDNLHVIFDNNPSGTVDVYFYYKKFASDGTTVLVSEKQLFPTVYKTWSTSLEAVLDSQDRINLAFGPGVPGGMVETFYARIDLLGNLEIGPIQLSTGPSYHSAYPYLAIDDYDNNYVFWSDYETGNADIYYSALDMNGSVVVPPTRLTDDNLTQHSSYMGAVFDSTNTCIWSYFDGDIFGGNGTHVIYAGPPETTIVPGLPRYGDSPTFVTSATDFSFTVLDRSGSGIRGTYYHVDSGGWLNYSLSGPFTVVGEGPHSIFYNSTDNLGINEPTKMFDIVVDDTPPTSSPTPGEPNHTSGQTWISSLTPISISTIDAGVIPVGINFTRYRVWNGGSWTPWADYSTPFSIGPVEGVSHVEFFSEDLLWNQEPTQNATYIVDNTPPVTQLHVGEPNYTATDTWVNSSTHIALTAIDGGEIPVGVNRTSYRIWAGSWSSWEEYSASFRLSTEGLNFVEYHSIDLLGNQESAWNESLIVDDTPPTTLAEIGGPKYRGNEDAYWNVTSSAIFYLNSTDGGPVPCGVRAIEFSIDGVLIGNYSEPFTLQGYEDGIHRIDFRAIDNMMNAESRLQEHNTIFVNLDNTPPSTTIEPNKTRIDLREAFALEADDGQGSGVQEILFSIDGGEWQTYTEEFSFDEYGRHTISYRSVDNLGNTEQPKELAFEIPRPSVNWKPLIALIFTIILLVCGLVVSRRRPIEFQAGKSFAKTFLLISFPFWLAEAITGIVSLVTGWLSIPPFLGVGTFLDLGILVGGLAVLAIHGKGEEESKEEDSGKEDP